jgi:hypothetical protein
MPRKQTTTQQQSQKSQVKSSVEPKRKGLSWSSNEVNRLHNEYELRELSVYQIAELHSRGVRAILHKLADEGLISSTWSDARGWDFVATEKKALPAPVKRARRMQHVLTVDDTHDYTGSCDETETDSDDSDDSHDSDEEYTLDDAKRDYDPFSMRDKVEFFKNLIPSSLYR